MRSIAYVADTARIAASDMTGHPAAEQSAERAMEYVSAFHDEACRTFMEGWREGMGESAAAIGTEQARSALLRLFLMEKAAYEIRYEAANRPAWIGTPIAGLHRFLATAAAPTPAAQGERP